MEKEDELKELRKELAKLTKVKGPEDQAYDEWKAALNELADLEEKIQVAQKRFQEAQRKLQLAARGVDQ
jgi:septation ring formation regulator EzrA